MKHPVDVLATPTNVRDLLAFAATIDMSSLTGAAKLLGESKGSISRRLSRLEGQMGVTLVRRSARGVQPTESGETYHRLISRALGILAEASAAIQPTAELAGLLRISVSHGFGLQILGPIIGRFASAHSGLRLNVTLNNSPHLHDDDIDVAIHPDRQVGKLSVASVKLLHWKMRFVAAPAYIARLPIIGNPQDLSEHPVLLGGLRGDIATSARKPGLAIKRIVLEPALTSDSVSFVRQSTLAGHGVGFIPSVIVDEDIIGGRLIDLFPDYEFPEYEGSMYMLSQSARFVSGKVAAFRDFMIAALQPERSPGAAS